MIKFAVAYTGSTGNLYFIRPEGATPGNATTNVSESALLDTPEEAVVYDYARGWEGDKLFIVAVCIPSSEPTLLKWTGGK